jgi:hypothetical protein
MTLGFPDMEDVLVRNQKIQLNPFKYNGRLLS